jgi:hypothetical protein
VIFKATCLCTLPSHVEFWDIFTIIWIKDQHSKLTMNFSLPNTQTFERWKLNIKTRNFKVETLHTFSCLQITCYNNTMHKNRLHIATQSLHTQIS